MPKSIVTDRDLIFTSRFWQETIVLTSTNFRRSSSHHPHTYGTIERKIQWLDGYFRCFTHACPIEWAQWLSLAKFWYNFSMHSTLDNKSPFEVLYDYSSRHFGVISADTCPIPELDVSLKSVALCWDCCRNVLVWKNMLTRSVQTKCSRLATLFLSCNPIVSLQLHHEDIPSCCSKFYGPKVLERVGYIAYRL